MKKIKILMVLLIASLSGYAQTALCLENNSDCEVHFAIYGEALAGGCPILGCNSFRIDVKVGPFSAPCFSSYDDIALIAASSGAAGWSGGVVSGCTFRYTRAELQQLSPCSGCGVTVGINACGLSPTDTNCGRTLTWSATPGGVPGDVTITWP